MHIYISGPAELHAETADRLDLAGMKIVNTNPPTHTDGWPPASEFIALVNAEAVYMTPGWANAGTRSGFERAIAAHLGLRIYGARA